MGKTRMTITSESHERLCAWAKAKRQSKKALSDSILKGIANGQYTVNDLKQTSRHMIKVNIELRRKASCIAKQNGVEDFNKYIEHIICRLYHGYDVWDVSFDTSILSNVQTDETSNVTIHNEAKAHATSIIQQYPYMIERFKINNETKLLNVLFAQIIDGYYSSDTHTNIKKQAKVVINVDKALRDEAQTICGDVYVNTYFEHILKKEWGLKNEN